VDEPRQVRGGLVVLGIVLGVVATFLWFFAVFILLLSYENSADGPPDWLAAVLFVLPLPVSIVLLCLRRTRQAAAGFVMGLAIGTIVLAGFCSSLVVLPSLGA
jgi:hypothetical protein